PVTDQLLSGRQLELIEKGERTRDGHLRELVDRLLANGDREYLRLQARALADRAGPEAHVLLDPLPLVGRVGLTVAALKTRDDAVEGEHVLAPPPHPVAVLDVELL